MNRHTRNACGFLVGFLFVGACTLLVGCAHGLNHSETLPNGHTATLTANCITHPLSPSACYYVVHECNGHVCEERRSTVATQAGWLNPNALGAAALIGWGLSESGTEVNQIGGGASAEAEGGNAYSKASSKSIDLDNHQHRSHK